MSFLLMDHHSFILSEQPSMFCPLSTTLIFCLSSFYLLSHSFFPHFGAPYQPCCAVFSSHLWVEVMLQEDRKGLVRRGGDLILKLISLVLTHQLMSTKMQVFKWSVQWPGSKILVGLDKGSLRWPREQDLPALKYSSYLLVTALAREGSWLWKCPLCPLGAAHDFCVSPVPPLWVIRISSLSFCTFSELPRAPACSLSSHHLPSMA